MQEETNNSPPSETTVEKKEQTVVATPDASQEKPVKEKRENSQRQNRGRRQPNRKEGQEDNKGDQQRVYRKKKEGSNVRQSAAAAGGNIDELGRPMTTRNRRGREMMDDATPNGGEERKADKNRARSNRRKRNKSNAPVIDGEEQDEEVKTAKPRNQNNRKGGAQGNEKGQRQMTEQEKTQKELERKKEKMSHQYTPFAPKRTFNSRFTEYQFAEWRKRKNNVFVTIETVTPPMPKKVLEEPDDAQYHLDVAHIDEEIEKLNEQFEELKSEQHETRSKMRDGQQGRNPIRDSLRELFGELALLNQEKKGKLAQIEAHSNKMQAMDRELQKVRKNVHPIYNESAKLEAGIRELENRLQTNAWSKQDEAKLIKEIDQVKESKPYFKKVDMIRKQIAEEKEKREEVKKLLTPTNKIIGQLKEKIGTVKKSENVFDERKKVKEYDMINVNKKIEDLLEKISSLRTKKRQSKETFYGSMCDYEIQQSLIKDIEWIDKTKTMVVERAERNAKYEAERKERNDQRKKMAEAREKQRAEIKAQQDARRKEQDEKKREWELAQLEKLDQNPFMSQIDLCEELIYFCAKNKKQVEEEEGPAQKDEEESKAVNNEQETAEARDKRLLEEVNKGKIEIAPSKQERDSNATNMGSLKVDKKKKHRKRDGPSAFYYEDDNRIDLDYQTIQKFGHLSLSPITDLDHVEDCNKNLVALRDALKIKGKMQQIEGKAKFSRDDTITKSEEYVSLKESYEKIPEEVRSKVDSIQASSSFRRSREEAEDVDVNDESGRRPARRGGRDGPADGQRQRQDGNEKGDRGDRRGKRSVERKDGGQEKPAKKSNKPQEKIAGNMDAFPEL